ncbi:MAG: 30S ribosomal protein S8e [Candidatus Bathyarchaeota archaeon]
MAWHHDLSKRKPSGAKSRPYRTKRKFERGRIPIGITVGERYAVTGRTRGGGSKVRLFTGNMVQVSDPKTKESQTVKILKVIENPSNVDYDRRGIITKGTIIDTELGTVKVTSRPGQDGVVNAVILEHKIKT